MKIKKVVVAGGGVLGSQIAYQTAFCGFDVTILVRETDNQEKIFETLKNLKKTYIDTIELMSKDKEVVAKGILGNDEFNKETLLSNANDALNSINIEINQSKALEDADLLVESITENVNIKANFYKEISRIISSKTIITTNSSTLLPSKLANSVLNNERFLAMHFANTIYKNNMVEVMGHNNTDEKVFKTVVEFTRKIKMIPLEIKKEKSGYLLNSMLVPFLLSALDLYANGISDPKNIDDAWKLGTGAPKGPFEIMDTVGLMTAKNIVEQYQKVPSIINPLLKKMMLPYNYKNMLNILNKYIDEGKLGKSTKEGFYKYND